MDDSASMLCARVMRGISSMASRLTPASASARAASSGGQRLAEADNRLPAAQQRQVGRAGLGVGAGAATCRITSAAANTSSARRQAHALFGVLGIGEAGALAGARLQSQLARRSYSARPIAPGTIATRRSPGAHSLTTPTVIPKNLSRTAVFSVASLFHRGDTEVPDATRKNR